MANPVIQVDRLSKYYQVHYKQPGLQGSLRSLFRRQYTTVKAVEDISFTIEEGEVVGFLGPNGAGKTTTLKCLTGLLYPTSGSATVLGYIPHHRDRIFLNRITLVMGQRNQLMWDLPAMETFLVNQAIYAIPEQQFRASLDELVELLGLAPLLNKQVRKLSLGERMKCELAAALLHRPQVLFLDEPTLGLDIGAQETIRSFLSDYNRRYQAIILLTSHYMADVTALARRILVIEHGRLLYDGNLQSLVEKTAPYKYLHLTMERAVDPQDVAALGEIEMVDDLKWTLRVPRMRTKETATLALARLPVADVTITDPPIEAIIQEVFRQGEAGSNVPVA